ADNCAVDTIVYKEGAAVITSPHVFAVGPHTVDVTITDIHGNTASSSFSVTVTDNEMPAVNVPANFAVNNDSGLCSASVTFAATPADNCAVNTIVYKEGATVITSPHVFAVGPHTVSVTVTDIHGNTASGSFSVTVTDNELPAVNVPANIAVNNDPGLCSASVSFAATPADNCAVDTIVYKEGATVISSPHVFAVGPHTVSVTVTDIHGNTASGSFSVTVTDNELPAVNVPANIAVNNDPGLCSASVSFAATPADNCAVDTIVYKEGTTVISSPHVFAVGPHTVDVTATDIHGNTASGSFSVNVTDNEMPAVNVPANIAVNNDSGLCSASVTFAASPADNCAVDTIVYKEGTTVITSPHVFTVGPHTVDVTVTDIHGNTASGSFSVTVTDNELPTVNVPAYIAVNNDVGLCSASVSFAATPADNCAVDTFVYKEGTTVITSPHVFAVGP